MERRLYVKNIQEWSRACERNYHTDRQLEVNCLTSGILLPPKVSKRGGGQYSGGVCDENFNFVAGMLRMGKGYTKNGGYFGIAESYKVSNNLVKNSDETVIFGGVLIAHFGHFILECMSRLWYVLENPDVEHKIAFILIRDEKEWYWRFFELLGIQDRVVLITQPTRFKNVIIPEEAVHSWKEYTDKHYVPYKKIKDAVPEGKYEKIYLTRTQLTSAVSFVGEEYFEEYYKAKGYTVVAPETLPLAEQISILKGAKEVVATIGSISHLAIFCNAGTKLTLLCRVDDDTLPPQCLVNQAAGLDVCIVDVSLNFLYATRAIGIVQLGVNQYWKEYVKDKFNDDEVESTLEKTCYEYLYQWCKYWADPSKFRFLKNMDMYTFFERMYRGIVGQPLGIENNDVPKDEIIKTLQSELNQYKELHKNILQQLLSVGDSNEMIEGIAQNTTMLDVCPVVMYEVHVARKGWLGKTGCGKMAGEIGSKLRIEALKISVDRGNIKLFYSVYNKNSGWSEEYSDNEVAGTVGQSLPILGISIRIDDAENCQYGVMYRIVNSKEGVSSWYEGGEKAVVQDDTFIEALEIRVYKKL